MNHKNSIKRPSVACRTCYRC
ncbi:hypothetical protein AAGX41_08695 [Staphylococcus aureus]|nr:hypothetical protein UM818_13155 [Staphylococcus aureus]WRN39568.1 hypothetical protein UM634_05170 [Staphylococcus aureus]